MQFYWLTTFGVIAGDPEFCQIWGWCWNINKIISFHFRLFPRKTNDKVFQKSKKLYFGTMRSFWPFLLKFGQKWIFLKKRLCQFLNIPIIYHRAKNQKKLMPFLRKMLNWRMDGQTDGRIDRQPWFCRTLCRTGVQLLK